MAVKYSNEPNGITHHTRFRDALADAHYRGFRADPRVRVRDEEQFERMRRHVMTLHEGIDVAHSFVDTSGQIFDCIPIEQQLSLRGTRGKLPQPPSLQEVAGPIAKAGTTSTQAATPPSSGLDRYGNSAECPAGHIPVRRITLDEMTRFGTLEEFQSKGPLQGGETNPSAPVADASKNHRFAYTQQVTANLGAHNFMNIWAPAVGDKQIFSLAQHWYSGGIGAAHQTLEVGWQVYPGKYGHSQPTLFIFWTNDNYNTSRNYNLENPGFVQTNSAWKIGGAISPVSTDGSSQYELEVGVYLYQGNWWLYIGGTGAANTVGYFPTSIYNSGAMATNADQFLMGGETVCEEGGVWPAMGSGAFASAGWTHAAYQRDIFYFPTTGGATYATLDPKLPSPACYTDAVAKALPPWNVYFFYGGAGGGDC